MSVYTSEVFILAEHSPLRSEQLYIPPRELLRRPAEFALAIDPLNPAEIDDAISINVLSENQLRVSIHVADGGLLLNSPGVIALARERMWTRYDESDERNHRLMIDQAISLGALGLDCNHFGLGAPAITISFTFDTSLRRVSDLDIAKTRVHTEVITYDEFNARLLNDDEQAHNIARLARLINIDVDTPAEFSTNSTASDSVGEIMVAANRLVAEEMRKHSIPWLFRNHVQKTHNSLKDCDISQLNATVHDLLDAMGRARYSSIPERHEGLNLLPYTHFTSPLRRFADLVNHLTLHALLSGKELPFSLTQLEFIAQELAEATAKEIGYITLSSDYKINIASPKE